MRFALIASFLLILGAAAQGVAGQVGPSFSDINGDWRLSHVIGSTEGGVTAEDPKAMLGKVVHWGPADVQVPGYTCTLRDPAIRPMENRRLETSIWGGQKISGLLLSKQTIAKAFGKETTPVYDGGPCATAIMIDHDRIILELESGWIYRLDRVIPRH